MYVLVAAGFGLVGADAPPPPNGLRAAADAAGLGAGADGASFTGALANIGLFAPPLAAPALPNFDGAGLAAFTGAAAVLAGAATAAANTQPKSADNSQSVSCHNL